MDDLSRLFLVLCIHRSGSSATAGVLQILGIHLGETLIGPLKGNRKGHYENERFVRLNDEILQAIGASWDRPPSETPAVNDELRNKMKRLIAEEKRAVWGLKDPRTVLTFECWEPLLTAASTVTYIFVHRPLQESIRSLAKREQISYRRAAEILQPYHQKLQSIKTRLMREQKDFLEVHFSALLRAPETFVAAVNEKLGRRPDERLNEVRLFLDERLKHF